MSGFYTKNHLSVFTIMLQYQNSFRKSSNLCGLGVQINDSTLFVERPFKSHSNNMYDDWSHFPLITDEICYKITCYVWKVCQLLSMYIHTYFHYVNLLCLANFIIYFDFFLELIIKSYISALLWLLVVDWLHSFENVQLQINSTTFINWQWLKIYYKHLYIIF